MMKGHAINMPPVRFIWLETTLTSKSPAQVAFSVPKKNFRRAVDRNRIKRQMRECYRAHKNQLYDFFNATGKKQYAIMLVFTARKAVPFSELMLKFTLTLQRFEKDINKSTNTK